MHASFEPRAVHHHASARKKLLAWFGRHKRFLPWRTDADPYRIWLSEVMLQQTQVVTVVPYFIRFLDAFPTMGALASADEADVLRLWEGLGYYRRARHLHRAARLMVEHHAGQVPRDAIALRQLPGIGRYTLGAILSQAYGLRWPVVDANVTRVLCRWHGCETDPRSTEGQRWLWRTAERMLPRSNVGAFNQALMELGALVCTPRQPDCSSCPIAAHCVARRSGTQRNLPQRGPLPAKESVNEVAVVVQRGRRVLLVQRSSDAQRWASLWEFPHAATQRGENAEAAADRVLLELTNLRGRSFRKLGVIRHAITRFNVHVTCWHARWARGRFSSEFYQGHAWLTLAELHSRPLSSPQRRLVSLLTNQE